ncbi:hypothetical protein [Jiangella endophytica]|uniref:hypothetical protein n=1 Tax=Jiangella endophytica TaxID=1623398 RepID=UPI000E3516CA|nr:hypothetical protein [Jiangella endophytica]
MTSDNDDAGRVFDGYARFYAPLAMVVLGLMFVPLFEDRLLSYDTAWGPVYQTHGSLWEIAGRGIRVGNGANPAMVAIALTLVVVALCVAGSFRPRSAGLPAGIAGTSVPLILMLVIKPGSGDLALELSPAGHVAIAIAAAAVVLATVHTAHYARWRRLSRAAA